MKSIQSDDVCTADKTGLIPLPDSAAKTRSRKTLFIVGILSFGVIFGRVATFVASALWLDSQNGNFTTHNSNVSEISVTILANGISDVPRFQNSVIFYYLGDTEQTEESKGISNVAFQSGQNATKLHAISAFYIVLTQQFICTAVFGIALLCIICMKPDKITDRERQYPKWHFFGIGFSMALSSLLVNSASSGSKTAPYLQGILMNFSVPLTFTIRFLILRKRPTLRKVLCAALVVITEFVCLIPTVFPSLESRKQRQTEGGAEGVARIIWPLIFVLSQVPYAIQSTIIEKITKEKSSEISLKNRSGKVVQSSPASDQINMTYFLFWTSAFTFMSGLLLFWTQLIPDFSDVTSLKELGTQLWFNMQCEFAGSTCSGYVTLVSSINILANLLAAFSICNLLRWSEGASFLMVVSTIRTPVLFLFWTVFQEQPFRWFPHASLSTWLSIGAIFVMLPAIYVYSTGPPEHDPRNSDLQIKADHQWKRS